MVLNGAKTLKLHSPDNQELSDQILHIHETFRKHSEDIQVTFKTHSD